MRNFESESHALFAGMLIGLAWRHGLDVEVLVDADGDYMPRWKLNVPQLPSGVELYLDVPAPPPDLDLATWLASVVEVAPRA